MTAPTPDASITSTSASPREVGDLQRRARRLRPIGDGCAGAFDPRAARR